MLPLSKLSNDNKQFIVVDLPLPLGPSNPNISPSFTLNDKLSTALSSLYFLVKSLTSIKIKKKHHLLVCLYFYFTTKRYVFIKKEQLLLFK